MDKDNGKSLNNIISRENARQNIVQHSKEGTADEKRFLTAQAAAETVEINGREKYFALRDIAKLIKNDDEVLL
jgi:hypothetical protein